MRKNIFIMRADQQWSKLPRHVVLALSLEVFQSTEQPDLIPQLSLL